MIIRHIAQAKVVAHLGDPWRRRGSRHCRQHLPGVKQPLSHRVGKHCSSMIATHAPALVGHQVPNRKHMQRILPLNVQHREGHVPTLLRLHQVEQRMLSPVSVPKREDGVVGCAIGLVDFLVHAAITSIDIHIHRRIDKRVVIGGVEHGLLVLGARNPDARQLFLPTVGSLLTDLCKRLAHGLLLKVAQGALHAYG